MEDFLRSVERQGYRMAMFACRNPDDALDLVQEAMCSFVAKYSTTAEDEWKLLFYRVLQNKIRDFHRREAVRKRWRSWFRETESEATDPLEQLPDPGVTSPEHDMVRQESFARLEQALRQLSLKQRQVFLLRVWEELSVEETARVMSCSTGTVKTHFFRANEQLRRILGNDWP